MDELIGFALTYRGYSRGLHVLAGGVVYLSGHPYPSDYRVFRGEPERLRVISGIFCEAMVFHAR
jgi:hypothetical protein